MKTIIVILPILFCLISPTPIIGQCILSHEGDTIRVYTESKYFEYTFEISRPIDDTCSINKYQFIKPPKRIKIGWLGDQYGMSLSRTPNPKLIAPNFHNSPKV